MLKALKSAICLAEEYPNHPKTVPALAKLFVAWLNMDDEAKLNSIGKEPLFMDTVSKEINDLGCPATVAEVPGVVTTKLSQVNDPQ